MKGTAQGIIAFSCHACRRSIRTPASYAGRTARCPGCRTSLRAPLPDPGERRPVVLRHEPAPRAAAPRLDRSWLLGGLFCLAAGGLWLLVGMEEGQLNVFAPLLTLVGVGCLLGAAAGRPVVTA